MSAFTLWIDADACPRDAKELVYRAAERLQVRTVLVANSSLTVPRSKFISTVRVAAGLDVADGYIVRESLAGDVAVTADIPLAAALVPKGVLVIDPRGEIYTEDNVQERLAIRDFMKEIRDAGVPTGGPKPFDARTKQLFANAIDRALTEAVRRK